MKLPKAGKAAKPNRPILSASSSTAGCGNGLKGKYQDDMFNLAKGTGGGFYFISGRE